MSKLARVAQKFFGSTASTNQIAKFGSLAAGSPTRYSGPTADPVAIQSLGNFLQGWFGAAVGSNSPAEEDMNALFYLAFYQLSYLFQEGVPEYDSTTTYWTNSLALSGGVLYQSVADSNVGESVTNPTYWKIFAQASLAPTIQIFTSGGGTYTPTNSNVKYLKVRCAGGGGGGGSSPTTTSSQSAAAGGGGGGGYVEELVLSPLTSYSYSVGAGGAGGATGASHNGSNGGTTTFGTTFLSATGGTGSSGATASSIAASESGGTGGNTLEGGNLLAISGGIGINSAIITPGAFSIQGIGGLSYLCTMGNNGLFYIVGTSDSGSSVAQAPGIGQGGNGGFTQNNSAGAGQQGGNGIIIVEEYYQ